MPIEIVGRPRASASRRQADTIGSNSTGSLSSTSNAARSSGNSFTSPGNTSSHNDSTCPPSSRNIHNPLNQESDHLQAEFSRSGRTEPPTISGASSYAKDAGGSLELVEARSRPSPGSS